MANLNKNPTALTLKRRAAGLTRTQLAKAVGISDRTIERWEQRRSDIADAEAASVLDIATALNCDVADILDTVPKVDMSQKIDRAFSQAQKKPADTNLKKFRVAAGFTLEELSNITGLQLQAIAAYEAKRNNINCASARAVFALAAALNVPFAEILDR